MADARDYVLAIENNKAVAAQIATKTADKLQNKEATLIDIVQSLGEYINDEDPKIRARAVSYLTAIITALPPRYLTRQQIQVLCQFLCDRIEDGGAIESLSQLQSLDRFTTDMAQIVVRAIFEHFLDFQSITQSGRHRILQLSNDIMVNRRKALRDMGDEFVLGITSLVAGEKDPRNLMIVFSMLRATMIEWDISQHAEMLFDAVFAYFPITFRPPPNDPYGITAQDLKDRLRDCLSSTGLLAPWVFPALLDKLDSTSPATKKDVLQALASCGKNYDTSIMARYSITLWDSVKFEVLTAQEVDLADEALLVLEAIADGLSNSTNTSPTSSPLVQYLKPINKECLEHLQEPAQRQAKASGDILKAISSASTEAFGIVVKAIIPKTLVLYQSVDGVLQQRAILEVLNQIFESAVSIFGTWREAGSAHENLLNEFKDNLVALYSQVLMSTVKEEVSFRLAAAKGLLIMSKTCAYLEDNEIGLFVQYFNEIVLKEESYGRDELKKTAMGALAEISRFKPRLIMDITFPAFMANLPDDEDTAGRMKGYESTLEGLAEISVEKEPFGTLVRRLLNKFDVLLRGSESNSYPYTCAILSTILYVLDRASKDHKAEVNTYYSRVVVDLSKKVVASKEMGRSIVLKNVAVLDLLGRIDNLIIRNSSIEQQREVGDNLYNLFAPTISTSPNKILLSSDGRPELIILSTWLLASLPRDSQALVFNSGRIALALHELIQFTRQCQIPAVQVASLRQISLYVNKHLNSQELGVANTTISSLSESLANNPNHSSVEVDLRLLFTISKALILRIASNTNSVLQGLLSLLDPTKFPPQVGRSASYGFSSILASDDVLSKTNSAQIRLLAPQRVFQTLTPLISTKFKESTSPDEKQNYLTALSGILATVPSEIVMPELPTLLPLLLQSIDISDQSVKTATLETLAVVIANNPSALEESGHIPALAKRLLSTAALLPKSEKTIALTSLPRTRKLATRCIALLPRNVTGSGSRTNPLLALKREVLQGLAAVLDDPRRDVRKEAVDARAAWIRGVDDASDDDDSD